MSLVSNREHLRGLMRDLEFRSVPTLLRSAAVSLYLPDPFTNIVRTKGANIEEFILIHVPKTAGTSITRYFDYHARHIPLSRYFASNPARAKQTFKVAFVRNPLDRLHSAFNYLHSSIGVNRSIDVRWAEQNLSEFSSFSDFVDALGRSKERRKLLRWTHFRPQISWIIDRPGGSIALDFLGQFEDLENEIKRLSERLGIETMKIGHDRKPRKPRGHHELTMSQIRIVHDMYKLDYELLGYPYE